jgi:hypothetical protein
MRVGFSLRIKAFGPQKYHQLMFSWFATDDPRLYVQYTETSNVNSLAVPAAAAGTGITRTETFTVPFYNWN